MKKAKKNLLKVSLIVLAVVLVVCAVLVFLKTRVQPPQKLNYTNQYTENIHQAAEQLAHADEQELERNYQIYIDRIELLKQEGLITGEEYNNALSEFVNAYVPVFRNWCEQQFNQPTWPSETLQFMQRRVSEVKRYSIVSPENVAKLNEVDKIVKDYNAAWKLKNVAIRSSSDARSNLTKAGQFKRDAHLSKCTALVNMLNDLPSVYQRSHLNYVNALVRGLSMSNFPYAYQIRDWRTKYNNARSAANDYNGVASSLYHTTTTDFNINSYYVQAKQGFAQKITDSWSDEADVYYEIFNTRIN